MADKQKLNWNVEQLTDAEIHAAIHYLDPNPGSANKQLPQLIDAEIYAASGCLVPDPIDPNAQDNAADPVFVICVILVVLLIGCLGYAWLYW
jgi:uncharacterized membrane protein AbrB (regulator of aidB expression)